MTGLGFPGGSDGKESTCAVGLIPGLGRSPGEGHGDPLQCSCLENPDGRRSRRATAHGVAESDMTERLSVAWLIYHVVFISIVQQNDSVTHIYIHIHSFSLWFTQDIEYSSLCYTIGSYSLFILYMVACIW